MRTLLLLGIVFIVCAINPEYGQIIIDEWISSVMVIIAVTGDFVQFYQRLKKL